MKNVQKIQTNSFILQTIRRDLLDIISREHYTFISTFFSEKIQEGSSTIQTYGKMTMFDVRNELRLRIQMMKGRNNAKVRAYYKEQDRKSKELLERLKQTQ